MDTSTEATLGIGLVRNEEYIGLYLNLTAWNINSTTNVIPMTLRKGFKMITMSPILQLDKELGPYGEHTGPI